MEFDIGDFYGVWYWRLLWSLRLGTFMEFDSGDFYGVWCWGLLWSLILGTFMEFVSGDFYANLSRNPYFLKIDQQYGYFTWLPKYVLLLPATWIRHKSGFCVTLSILILSTVTCSPAIHRESTVAFILEECFRERCTLLCLTYSACLVTARRISEFLHG
jgi:hypothetical protein